jgi:hypothetical protein
MIALQTDSSWNHIRGYGCFASVGIDLATYPYGHYAVGAKDVENCVRAGIAAKLVKDNDVPTTMPSDQWFRVEVQDFNAWVEFVGKYFSKPVKCARLEKRGSKLDKSNRNTTDNWLKTDTLIIPMTCNALVLEYDSDGIAGGLSHFVDASPTSGKIQIAYNPDPKIPLKALVSARLFTVTKA